MTRFNPAHVNPPRATTPEEAERDKRGMTSDDAARRRHDDESEAIPQAERARNEQDFREQGGSLTPDPDRDRTSGPQPGADKAMDTPPPMPPD